MNDVWEFGEKPLAQTERCAAALRRVAELVLRMEGPSPLVDDLVAHLERAGSELEGMVPPDPAPRVGDAVDGPGRVYLDHARGVADYNPAFPPYDLRVDGNSATATVRFGVLHEGPPGCVHGGFVSLLFDLVMQQHNCDVGVAGKTTRLEVDYRAPTPLFTDLVVTVERSVDAGRIRSTAVLGHGDVTCCTATMEAVAGRRGSLPAVSARRPS